MRLNLSKAIESNKKNPNKISKAVGWGVIGAAAATAAGLLTAGIVKMKKDAADRTKISDDYINSLKSKSTSGLGGVKSSLGGKLGKFGLSGSGAGNSGQTDTYVFAVDIDGIECAVFEDCSGLSVHTDVVEIAEGGENTTTRKFSGTTHYDNVRLSKGVSSGDNALLEWLQQSASASTLEKKSASLVMKSLAGEEMKRWNIYGAMPVKWDLPTNSKDKAGKNSAVVIENIEFALDRFEIA